MLLESERTAIYCEHRLTTDVILITKRIIKTDQLSYTCGKPVLEKNTIGRPFISPPRSGFGSLLPTSAFEDLYRVKSLYNVFLGPLYGDTSTAAARFRSERTSGVYVFPANIAKWV